MNRDCLDVYNDFPQYHAQIDFLTENNRRFNRLCSQYRRVVYQLHRVGKASERSSNEESKMLDTMRRGLKSELFMMLQSHH